MILFNLFTYKTLRVFKEYFYYSIISWIMYIDRNHGYIHNYRHEDAGLSVNE